MATIEYWIQLENCPWDASPHNIDRITSYDRLLGMEGMRETAYSDGHP